MPEFNPSANKSFNETGTRALRGYRLVNSNR